AEVEFFKEISDLTGRPADESKIRQILFSSLYKTASRFTGWETKSTFQIRKEIGNDPRPQGNYTDENGIGYQLNLSFAYALPLSFNKQLFLSAGYSNSFRWQGSNLQILKLSADFNMEHNYNWNTTLSAFGNLLLSNNEDEHFNSGVYLKSEMVVLNKLSIYSTLMYVRKKFDDMNLSYFDTHNLIWNKSEGMFFNLGFNYRIF
ncbi:MAG: hypothetical protein C0412_11870, partial [Flavobacterium sp.]|nr:hypothetical protein [Flavobacterium sp.]